MNLALQKFIKLSPPASAMLKALRAGTIIFVIGFVFSTNSHSASAATRTWTGTASGSWSNASNWGGTAPVTGDDLVFPGGASNLSNTNDLTESTIINSITLSGSGYTLSGNTVIIGAGLAGITDSVASGGNTIALDLRFDVTRDIIVTNTAETLTISGRITGVGGINKEGTGKLILSGANTFGGILKINVGVVNAQNNTALGTIAAGTEVVGGAALELQGTIDISYEPLTLRGYGVSNAGALRNILNNNTFRGLITLTSAGGTSINSDSGTLTLAGGVTGAFPLVIGGASNVTFSTTPLAIAGGTVTKNGAGTLKFNFPNTYTGLTTVNAGTLLYGVDNAILSGAITVTGGTLDIATFSDIVGTVTLGTLDLATGTITGSTGMLSATGSTATTGWVVYSGTISAIIAGDATTLTKTTLGTVTLTRPNQYTGATTISAGILEIQNNTALGLIDGTTTVSAGATLQINGSGLSIPEYITFSGTGHLYTGAIRNKTGNNTLTGLLTLGAAAQINSDVSTTLTVDTKGLSATTQALTIAGAGNTTFTNTAPIYGTSATLTKNDAGILNIESFSNFTGATIINRGTLLLDNAGAIPLSTISINSGGTLTLDNSATNIINRISDSLALTMRGGNFNMSGNATALSQETAGALTLSEGYNIVTVTPSAGGSTTMTFASFSRTAGASVLFRGTSFGSAPAANISTLMFTTAPTSPALAGAAGAANSTTISVLKGAFGDNSTSGTGTDMVTYNVGNTNGLRLLNGAGFSGEYSATLTTNTNVKLTGDVAASTVSINSLILNGFSITNASATITISNGGSLAGNILINSATNIAGASTVLGITTNELNIHATASSTISAVIGTAVAGSLTLSGTGNVTLSAANLFTGLTAVNGATLTYGINDALSSGGVTVNGGTLAMGATATDTVGAVILQNGSITGSGGVLSGTSYSFREGTVSAILGGGAAAVIVVATNAAPDAVVTLSGNNTYTGATTITSGILKLGATGSGGNTPLGTTGGSTSVASSGALDLNGFTLVTAEPISSLAGTGFGASGSSNMGAIMNSSASPATYSGAITLGSTPRINADYGALTISSAISTANTLTIGGFSDSTFSGVIGPLAVVLVKDGIGTLTLSNGNSSYTGTTTINAGTLKVGAVSVGGTNSPLGTTGGATAITTGARLDLNGFSLGIAEPITNLNGVGYGLGDFASGAIINSSGSAVTFTGAITLGAASTIKADSGQITLSGANSGAFALTLGGTGIGILSGTIASSSATVTKINTGTWTLSGASNAYTGTTSVNLGTLKIGAAGVTTSPLGTAVATTVYSGASLDLAGFALGIAEALNINGRGVNDSGALMNSDGAVAFTGAIVLQNDSRIANSGSGTLTLSGGTTGAFALYISGTNNFSFTTTALAMGTGTLTKQGAGTATISIASTYTGATRVDAGTLAEGVINSLSSGSLEVKGGTFDMGSGKTDTIGAVTLIGGSITGTGANSLTGTAYIFESGTISAILGGAVAVTKNTNNNVILSGVNTISSTLTINAGTVTISGSGSDVSVTAITVNLGGTLTLDNGTTAVASRILDTLVLTMNGGNFNFIGNTAALSAETMGQLLLSSGHNVVTVTPGAGGSTTLTFGAATGFNRTAGATVLFRGTSFGSTPAANVSTLMFTTAPTMLGGGSTTANTTTISVIKGAFGDNSLSGTGTDVVTYNIGNTNGLRLINGAGNTTEYSATLAANANVKLTGNVAASTVSINSLVLNGFGITDAGSAQTITPASASLAGNILINSATNIAGANTTLGITTFELDVLSTNTSTISAIVGTATTGSLVVSGSGNVTLSAANAYTGTTFINNATLTYGASNVISSGGVTIVGGTYNLNGNSDTVGSISINAGTIATGAGTLTGNGTFTTIANNNVTSIITGNLGLGANATFTINDGLMDNDALITAVISGAFTFAKAGSGVLELSGSNTYSGITTISGGTIRLGASGGATNTPLGTTAGGTVVSSGFSLDLNGYTLANTGTFEGLTISGTGIGGFGALLNTSSTAVTYSGLIILGASATITSNYGTMTISNAGSMTGTGFTLTLSGAGNGSLATQVNTSTAGARTKSGLGVWTISGDGNYTGATTISAGTLKLGAAGGATNNPFGTIGGATTVSSGAILDLNGFTAGTAEPITISGTGIANVGAFINSSNNSISYSGAITLGAAVRVANYESGVLTLTGAISGNNALTTVTVGGITQSSASVWSGTGTLTKEGSGTLILAGQNTMTGAMTVSTGILQLGASGGATNTPLGTNAGGVTVSSGAVLDLNIYALGGASTFETLNLSGSGLLNSGAITSTAAGANNFGAMTVTANSRVINSGAGLITFGGLVTIANTINFAPGGSGPITVSGILGASATTATLTKFDAGILTMGASLAPGVTTGLVRVNGGTLKYGVADALSTPTVTIAGGTLDLNGFNETNIAAVTLISGSIINSGGAASLVSTATYTLESGTVSAILGGTVVAAIAKNTGGQVILSGDNTFSGVSATIAVNAGYLNLRHNNALGLAANANTTTISAGATMELENSITIPAVKAITANGTGMVNAGAIRNVNGTNTLGANVTLGSTNVRINSDSGTLTIPTVSGNTLNAIFGGASGVSVTGAIGTTSGTLTKDGAGTLTLTGTNTYTGTTNLIAGILSANATAALGDGSATNTLILNGGTLQAAGTITSASTRAFILASNGTIDTNGNSMSIAGTLGGVGSLTKAGTGTLTVTGVTTLQKDLTVSAGTFAPTAVTISGTATQSIAGFNPTGTVTMTKTAGTATFTSPMNGAALTINGTGGTLDLGTSLTHTFTGDVTLTAGTLNGGSSTLNANSTSATAWNGTGSLFTAGTDTVNFGGGAQTLAASTTTFNNLTFSPSSGATINLQIGADLDDGQESPLTTWNQANSDWFGHGGTDNEWLATRFTGVTVPQGTILTSATYRHTAKATEGGTYTVNAKLAAQAADNGTRASGANLPSTWSYTTANTPFAVDTATNWVVDTEYSRDVTAIVQEIVNRGGWASGNAINMTILNNGSTGNQDIQQYSYDQVPAKAARLDITYAAQAVKTLSSATVINGTFTNSAGVTITTANQALTFGGDFTNSGTALSAGSSTVTISGTGTQSIAGFTTTGLTTMSKTAGTATLTSAVNGNSLTVDGVGGTLNLGTALNHTFTGAITLTNGTLSAASATSVTAGSFSGSNSNTRVLNLGSATWNMTGTGTVWDMATSTNATIIPGTSTIAIVNTSASGKTFSGGGKTYNNLTISAQSTVTWDPAAKGPGFTLSPDKLTATSESLRINGVRATVGASTGKRYYELTYSSEALFGYSSLGIANATYDVNTLDLGSSANAYSYGRDGFFYALGPYITWGPNNTALGTVIGVLVDLDNHTIAYSFNGNTSYGIPSSGTGIAAGTWYPAFSSYTDATSTSVNFGASPWAYAPPSGYVGWGASTSSSGDYTIVGNNTFNTFTDINNTAHSLLFTTGSTQHASVWNLKGSAGKIVTINSTTTGTHTLVKDNGGEVSADYLNIQHSVATSGTWLAGLNSVNNQNVASAGSGWIFSTVSLYRGGGGGTAGGESSNGAYATWDAANKGTNITLSNGNLTETATGTSSVRATIGKSSGKWYWEYTFDRTLDPGNNNVLSGVATSAAAINSEPGADAFGFALLSSGNKYNNASSTAYTSAPTDGDVIGVALDMTNLTLAYYKNNTALGTAFTIPSGTYYPIAGSYISSSAITANFGASAFSYTVPSGYNPGIYANTTGGGAGGGTPTTATGTVVQSGGVVQSVTVVSGGSGYTAAPIVSFCTAGSGAAATAILTSGVVTSVTIQNGGTGYTGSSTVLFGSNCPTGGGGGGGGGDVGYLYKKSNLALADPIDNIRRFLNHTLTFLFG